MREVNKQVELKAYLITVLVTLALIGIGGLIGFLTIMNKGAAL